MKFIIYHFVDYFFKCNTGHLFINDSIMGIPKPSSNKGNTKASAFLYKSINKLSFPLICFTEFFSISSNVFI